jgi:hypothetical protein
MAQHDLLLPRVDMYECDLLVFTAGVCAWHLDICVGTVSVLRYTGMWSWLLMRDLCAGAYHMDCYLYGVWLAKHGTDAGFANCTMHEHGWWCCSHYFVTFAAVPLVEYMPQHSRHWRQVSLPAAVSTAALM